MFKFINLSYYNLRYIFLTKVFGRELPYIGGIAINDSCNLHCLQCTVSNRGIPDMTIEEVEVGLQKLHSMGIRFLYIEGGEPFMWKDNDKELNDVVELARKIGFKFIVIYTNGTFPIITDADIIYVSMDGLKDTHNMLRGNSYDLILSNIDKSPHRKIFINYTINKKNEKEIELFCNEMSKIDKIKGVFFYFYTPCEGENELYLSRDEIKSIIDRILILKDIGYKIVNSRAALNGAYHDTWERPNKLSYLYAENKLYQCCRSIGNKKLCEQCGYLGFDEIYYISKLNLNSIFTAFKYL